MTDEQTAAMVQFMEDAAGVYDAAYQAMKRKHYANDACHEFAALVLIETLSMRDQETADATLRSLHAYLHGLKPEHGH